MMIRQTICAHARAAIVRSGILLAALALLSPAAECRADVITLDFDNDRGGSIVDNYVSQGFVLSPSCHYDFPTNGFLGTNFIGIDSNSCSVLKNPNYLGPPETRASLYITHVDDTPFSLLSLYYVNPSSGPGDSEGPILTSSKGGSYTRDQRGLENFSGPEWADVDWLLFRLGFDFGAPQGFDNLTLEARALTEPGSVALFALSLAGLGITCRMRRTS